MKLNGYVGTITESDGFLYRDGKTDYKILISDKATVSEKFAAEELTRIFALANVEIETVTESFATKNGKFIAVGKTAYFRRLGKKLLGAEFKFDGYIIESVGDIYVIKGVGDTGTCFGVYGFMEYIAGYRYYAPDEIAIEKTARNKEFHIKDIPTFFGRNAYSYETLNDVEYSFRLRVNGEFVKREAKHGEGSPWSSLTDQSYVTQILDYKKYEKDHPDWYVWGENVKLPQICYSKGLYDEEFYNTFLSNLINNYIIPEKNKNFFMLGMSDNWAFCDCEKCHEEVEKYTKSGLALRFINKVADGVEKWRKENAPVRVIYVIGFAYISIFEPPVVEKDGEFYPIDESVIARDNVMIQYAPILANYKYPLMDIEHNKPSRDALLGWTKIAKNLCIWDYRSDFRTQSFFYPTTITAQANNDLYVKIGVKDVFNQGQPFTAGGPFVYMDNFARARIHWNAKESYDELIAEFNRAYYKDACPYVEEYLHALEKFYDVMVERGWNVAFDNHASIRKEYYTLEDLYKFKNILDKALDKARGIQDVETRGKVVTRVESLTLFYKFVLLLCFTFEIEKDEAYALIEELRSLSKKVEFEYFWRRTPTEVYLKEAEKLLNGEISSTPLFPMIKENENNGL